MDRFEVLIGDISIATVRIYEFMFMGASSNGRKIK